MPSAFILGLSNQTMSASDSSNVRKRVNVNAKSNNESSKNHNVSEDEHLDTEKVSALVGCSKCQLRWETESGKQKRHSSTYTVCDIAKHRTRESLWIHARGSVFDVTPFLGEHPGGDKAFMVSCTGKGCDDDYDFHSYPAKTLWYKYKIGTVIQCDAIESPKGTFCIVS